MMTGWTSFSEGTGIRSLLCVPQNHFLHLDHWSVREGETIGLENERRDSDARTSWIVLKGEAIFDLTDPVAGSTRELVDCDSVIHSRNHAGVTSIHALQNLKLVRVTYSPHCSDSQ